MALVREAARVVRVVAAAAAGLAAAGALAVAALTLFLGTASSAAFSLSSLDTSSLPRFFPRVVLFSLVTVGLGAALVATGFGAGFASSLGAADFDEEAVGAVRVLLVAGAEVDADADAGAFFAGAALAGADFVGTEASRRSIRGVWRLVGGMRLTRRSRRDRRLAHWASHWARSFS